MELVAISNEIESASAAGALADGRSKDAQRVFCGHTHEALRLEGDGIEYYNSGSWTQENATYIAIDHQGARVLDYREPGEESIEQSVHDDLEMDFEDLLAD